eukprot:SAG11_NODE_2009_length_3927_cov_2.765674_2_plen_384_part_00
MLVWALEDADHTSGGAGGGATGSVLYPMAEFVGHKDTVEAVACHPTLRAQFCSGGDDKQLLFWDSRQGGAKPTSVAGLHADDINCLSWNPAAPELVATGCSDGCVQVFDTRRLAQPLHVLGPGTRTLGAKDGAIDGHSAGVMTLEWMPESRRILASGGEDAVVLLWDIEAADGGSSPVVFGHAGHRHEVTHLSWNPHSPHTVASLSVPDAEVGGAKIQLWRVSELLSASYHDDMEHNESEAVLAGLGRHLAGEEVFPKPEPAAAEVVESVDDEEIEPNDDDNDNDDDEQEQQEQQHEEQGQQQQQQQQQHEEEEEEEQQQQQQQQQQQHAKDQARDQAQDREEQEQAQVRQQAQVQEGGAEAGQDAVATQENGNAKRQKVGSV